MKKLDYIDGLKGIGALMVFFCHFVFAFYYAAYSLTGDAVNTNSGIEITIGKTPLNLLYSGNSAVCLFLVFSGFVLCLSYFHTRDKGRLKSAAWKRYFRLMPMILMINTVIFVLMSLGCYRNDEAAILTKSTVWFAGFNQFQPNFLQMLGESLAGCFLFGTNNYNGVLWHHPLPVLRRAGGLSGGLSGGGESVSVCGLSGDAAGSGEDRHLLCGYLPGLRGVRLFSAPGRRAWSCGGGSGFCRLAALYWACTCCPIRPSVRT